jgi:[ribosomal protein S5]-alanine N-acetyltransferase
MPENDLQLYTPQLILRDLVPADWSAIYALSQEPEVTRFQTWLRLSSDEAARQWVQNAITHNQRIPRDAYNLAIVTQQDNNVIGWIGWGRTSEPNEKNYNFGYALSPRVWGRGYMTEALQAAVTFMFGSLDAEKIFGECAEHNYGSVRVMEKAGLELISEWDERNAVTGANEKHRRYTMRSSIITR